MEQTTKDLRLLWKMVEGSFGNVDEVCNEISEAALQLAITPLEDSVHYKTVQRVLWVLVQLRDAFEVLKPDVEVIFHDEDEEEDD